MSSVLRASARSLRREYLRPRTNLRASPRIALQLSRGLADTSNSGDGGKSDAQQAHTGRTPPGPKDGAYPKILDEAPPPDPSEEVKKHNKEFENRHDRATNRIDPEGKDQVGKGYWSGDVGQEDENAAQKSKK